MQKKEFCVTSKDYYIREQMKENVKAANHLHGKDAVKGYNAFFIISKKELGKKIIFARNYSAVPILAKIRYGHES